MKAYIDIVKCYDISILDEEGNELMTQMVYANNQSEAMKVARDMKKDVENHPEIYDFHYNEEEY